MHKQAHRAGRLAGCWSAAWLFSLPILLAGAGASAQQPTALEMAQAMEQAMVDAIARAQKSVVAIARVRRGEAVGLELAQNVPPTSPDFVPNDYGTGVVVDRRGLILTTYHVLGNPQQNDYYVWINQRPYRASVAAPAAPIKAETLKAADPWMDLAVLQIEASDLEPIRFGDTKALKKGQVVIALGNPFAIARDGQVSASRGIIANLQRPAPVVDPDLQPQRAKETLHHYGTLIQTDAKLNIGSSGGPLINLKGEMIGLVTSLASTAGYEGSAGYAIPADEHFQRVVETLKTGREAEYGFLGVGPQHLAETYRRQGYFGAVVEQLVPATPAATAGLHLDDIITHVDGQRVSDANDLFRQLSSRAPEDRIQLTVLRGGVTRRQSLQIPVDLSKKYIDAPRKIIAQQRPSPWRGLHIDYATAVPRLFELSAQLDPRGCVGVLQVEAGSPAWEAGLRPGDFVSHVQGKRVSTPAQFYRAVASEQGPVQLRLTIGQGDRALRIVEAGERGASAP